MYDSCWLSLNGFYSIPNTFRLGSWHPHAWRRLHTFLIQVKFYYHHPYAIWQIPNLLHDAFKMCKSGLAFCSWSSMGCNTHGLHSALWYNLMRYRTHAVQKCAPLWFYPVTCLFSAASFAKHNFSILIECNISIYYFMHNGFGVLSKNSLPNPRSHRYFFFVCFIQEVSYFCILI